MADTPKMKELKRVRDEVVGTLTEINDGFFSKWALEYKRARSTALSAANTMINEGADGEANYVDREKIDMLHANLDRIIAAVQDGADRKTKFYKANKKESDLILKKLKDTKAELGGNEFLQDLTQKKKGATATPELVDDMHRLVNKFDYLYTLTDNNDRGKGESIAPLPKRQAGKGGEIGKHLDAMRNALDSMYTTEETLNDSGKKVVNTTDELKPEAELRQSFLDFNNAKKTLTVTLNAAAADNKIAYRDDIKIMQSDLKSFESKNQKLLDKRIAEQDKKTDDKEKAQKKVGLLDVPGVQEQFHIVRDMWEKIGGSGAVVLGDSATDPASPATTIPNLNDARAAVKNSGQRGKVA